MRRLDDLMALLVLTSCTTVGTIDPASCRQEPGEGVVIEVPLKLAVISTTFKKSEDLKPELSVVMDDLLRGEATKAAVETLAACTGVSQAAVEQHTRLLRAYFHHSGFKWGHHLARGDLRYEFAFPEVRLVYAYDHEKSADLDLGGFARFPRAGKRPAELLFVAAVACREDIGWDPKKVVARDLPRAPVKIIVGNVTSRRLHPRLTWVNVSEAGKGQPASQEMDLPPRVLAGRTEYASGASDPVWGVQHTYLSRPEALPLDAETWRVTIEDASCGRAVVEVLPPVGGK